MSLFTEERKEMSIENQVPENTETVSKAEVSAVLQQYRNRLGEREYQGLRERFGIRDAQRRVRVQVEYDTTRQTPPTTANEVYEELRNNPDFTFNAIFVP